MARIPATQFKAKCLELMDRVAERHETYVITKRGRPVAKLVPFEQEPRDSIFGWLRAKGSIVGDIISPATTPEVWATLQEWDRLNGIDRPPNNQREAKTRKSHQSDR